MEAAIGIEPMDKGFADLCLTTWLRRLNCQTKGEGRSCWLLESRPSPENLERETGFEPATSTLARSHSTAELLPLGESDSIRPNFFLSTKGTLRKAPASQSRLDQPAMNLLSELQLHNKRIFGRQTIVVTPPTHQAESEIPVQQLRSLIR